VFSGEPLYEAIYDTESPDEDIRVDIYGLIAKYNTIEGTPTTP
jgi:hypothetical protein